MLENTHNQNPPISIGIWHLHKSHHTAAFIHAHSLSVSGKDNLICRQDLSYTESHTHNERKRHTESNRERFNWPLTSFWIEDRSCVLNVWAIVEELCPCTAVLHSVSPLLPSFHLTVTLSLAQLPVVDEVHKSSTWVKVQIRIKYYSSKSTAFSILLEWKYKSTQFVVYLSKELILKFNINNFLFAASVARPRALTRSHGYFLWVQFTEEDSL